MQAKKATNKNYYTGCIDGNFTSYCYQVKTGSKPIAFVCLQTRYINTAVENAKEKYLLKTHIEDIENYPEWKTLYIYKHDYLLDIIKNLPNNPQTPYEHWVLGKACGYSDDAIGEFIENIIELDRNPKGYDKDEEVCNVCRQECLNHVPK